MIRVFIGYDHAESVAYHTLCHSIMSRASEPVAITGINLSAVKDVLPRDRDPMQSNEFAFSRFLVPYLCGYQGHAIFMDCDMLVLDDIAKLWAIRDDNYALQCVKHDHKPTGTMKYLGTTQTSYSLKNWTSVMLFNNERCKALTPDYVNTAPGLDLHQFKWLDGLFEIGELPLEWNFLVDYYPNRDVETISNLHYTEGGPYFADYQECSYADEWWTEFSDMIHCANSSIAGINKVLRPNTLEA